MGVFLHFKVCENRDSELRERRGKCYRAHPVDYDHLNYICFQDRVLAQQNDSTHCQVGIAQDRADKSELNLSLVHYIRYSGCKWIMSTLNRDESCRIHSEESYFFPNCLYIIWTSIMLHVIREWGHRQPVGAEENTSWIRLTHRLHPQGAPPFQSGKSNHSLQNPWDKTQ